MVGGSGDAILAAREAGPRHLEGTPSSLSLGARMAPFAVIIMVISGLGIAGALSNAHASPNNPSQQCGGCGAGTVHQSPDRSDTTVHSLGGGNLTSVVVGPPIANISVDSSMIFVASPVCTTILCPSGTTYQWNLTSTLFGALNTTKGQSVEFTSVFRLGTVFLFVNATLNGITKQSYPVRITINTGILPLGAYLYYDSANSGYAPLTVTFTGNGTGGVPPYTLTWNMGDGGSASGVTVTHTYSTAGTFTITLTVKDAKGSGATATGVVVVLSSNTTTKTLQASIIFDSSVIGHLPLNVTMTASVSGGTSPYTYSWSYGDGSTGSGMVVSHAYTSVPSGCKMSRCEYTVNLTATDSTGKIANATSQVTILVNSTLTFSVFMTDTPASGVAPLLVSFSANASGGKAPYNFSWAYGDSSTGTGASGQHTYMAAGTYTVVLTGIDSDGTVAQVTSTVLAYPPPTSNETGAIELTIVSNPVTGPAPLTSYFSASASGGAPPYTFNWSFGDNTQNASGSSVSHTYTSPGSYVATISVRDSVGNTATTGVFVTVTGGLNPPNQLAVIVTALKLHGIAPLTVVFTPSVMGGSAPYQLTWTFGDGASAIVNGTSPVTHTYLKSGNYYPILQVKDASGNVSTWSATVSGMKVTGTGGSSQQFTTTDWALVIAAVLAIALVVAVGVARRNERPPPSAVSDTDSFDISTPGEFAPESIGTEDEHGPPRPSPNDDPLHDVFAGIDPDAGYRAIRLKFSAATW